MLGLILLQLLGRDGGVLCNSSMATNTTILRVKCLRGCVVGTRPPSHPATRPPGHPATWPLSYFWFFRFRVSSLSSDNLSMLLSVTRLTTLSFTQTHIKDPTPPPPLSLSSQLQQTRQPTNWFNRLGSGGSHLCGSLSHSGHRARVGMSSSL